MLPFGTKISSPFWKIYFILQSLSYTKIDVVRSSSKTENTLSLSTSLFIAIRFFILSAHYRMQINFSKEVLDSAKASVERLYNAIGNLENLLDEVSVESLNEEENKFNFNELIDKAVNETNTLVIKSSKHIDLFNQTDDIF